MQYLVIAYDNEGVLEKRLEVREAHLESTRRLVAEGKIVNVAALIEDEKMVGSTLFVDFSSDDELNEWLENEPYVQNGVWNMEEFQIVPVKMLPKD